MLRSLVRMISDCQFYNGRDMRKLLLLIVAAFLPTFLFSKDLYPDYSDRDGWSKILGRRTDSILKKAQTFQSYEWTPVSASAYLEYERGENKVALDVISANRNCLNTMILAELAEGRGRFLSKIADFIWLETTRLSWDVTFPDYEKKSITPYVVDNAVSLAYACYFFKEQLDKMDPSIFKTVRQAVRTNLLDPFISGTETFPSTCKQGILTAFLLLSDDEQEIEEAYKRCRVGKKSFVPIESLIK